MHGRWGIFGGLFDPLHNGHIHLAREISVRASLDGILWVPTARPTHKHPGQPISFEHRVAMLKLALRDEANQEISEIEAEQNLPGYALDTVRALKKRYPKAELSFIIGADNVSDLVNWSRYEQLLDEIKLIAGSRGGVAPDALGPLADRVIFYEIEPLNISSSEIRDQLRGSRDHDRLSQLLPAVVLEYIENLNLYR